MTGDQEAFHTLRAAQSGAQPSALDDQCAACGVLRSAHAIQDSAHEFRGVTRAQPSAGVQPNAGAQDQQRKDFEEYEKRMHQSIERDASGIYSDDRTDDDWQLWQIAAETNRELLEALEALYEIERAAPKQGWDIWRNAIDKAEAAIAKARSKDA